MAWTKWWAPGAAIAGLLANSVYAQDLNVRPPVLVAASISDEDYPAEALASGMEGTVVARFVVTERGEVSACEVDQSSGSAALDQRTCHLLTERFRYRPARTSAGTKLAVDLSQVIAWRVSSPCPRLGPKDICVTAPVR